VGNGVVLHLGRGMLDVLPLLLLERSLLVQLMLQRMDLGGGCVVGAVGLDLRVSRVVQAGVLKRLRLNSVKLLGAGGGRVKCVVVMRIRLRRRRVVRHGQHPIMDLPIAVVGHRVSNRKRCTDRSRHCRSGQRRASMSKDPEVAPVLAQKWARRGDDVGK
jgi:hypothetical protein